jgi:hypothetical protein
MPHTDAPAPAAGARESVAAAPTRDPVRPRYGGASVDRIVPALLSGADESWLPAPVREADAVVVLVLDGLGWNLLDAHRGGLPVLGSMSGGPVTTVAPSTTAAALTSIATGLPPVQHGIVGFRMLVEGSVLNVLRWQVPYGRRAPDPFAVQRHTAFLGRPVPVVTKKEFKHTGFTEAHLRGAEFHGWSTTAVLVEQLRSLARTDAKLVYAYYPGVDTVAHEYGLSHESFTAELRFADELVGRILEALPERVALLVTADHGQVHVGDRWISLQPVERLVARAAGEGRFRYLYAPRGGTPDLLAAASEEYGRQAWVLSRDQLLDEGWLGPGTVTASIRRRIGDVVLAPHAPVAFVDPALPNEAKLVGAHGSLTPDEMLVPVVAARGTGTRG